MGTTIKTRSLRVPTRVRLLRQKRVMIVIVFQPNYYGSEPNNSNQCGGGKIKIEKRGTNMEEAATIALGCASRGTIGRQRLER